MSDPVDELNQAMEDLDISEGFTYPEEWRDNPDDPNAIVKIFAAEQQKLAKAFPELGAFNPRVVTDKDGTLKVQPQVFWHPDAAYFESTKEYVDIAYATLCRPVPEEERGKASGDRHILRSAGGEETEVITVPDDEVADHEAKGWRRYVPPPPSYSFREGIYGDYRKQREKPKDVHDMDNPANDKTGYLTIGNDLVERRRTKSNWKAGDLIGPGGSDPETKAQSPTYAASKDWKKLTEHRSATSGGHIFHYDRPKGVCVGWGEYDETGEWQSNGRAITKEMVKKTVEWSTDLPRALVFVDEDGDNPETLMPTIRAEHLPSRPAVPVSLYDAVNEDQADKKKRHKQHSLNTNQGQGRAPRAKGGWAREE